MEYKVGSLADFISGTHSAPTSKTKIVFETKRKSLPLKDQKSLENLNVLNTSLHKKGVELTAKKASVGKGKTKKCSLTLKDMDLSECVNNNYQQKKTVVKKKKHSSLKKQICEVPLTIASPEKEKSPVSTSNFESPNSLGKSEGHVHYDVSNNPISSKKWKKSRPGSKELPLKRSSTIDSRFSQANFNEETEHRTIFVKNIPYSVSIKEVKAKFKEFGPIESARFRCAVGKDTRLKKKVVVIKKQFHPLRSNICAFIRYKDPDSVDTALKAKGLLFNGHHLFVDRAVMLSEHQEQRKAVFLGNVPFDAEEDEIYTIFEPCGEIVDIRIVRDNQTGFGKGFAYVNFASADGVELALTFNGVKLKDRELRVSRSNPTKQKSSAKEKGKKPRTNIKRRQRKKENTEEKPCSEKYNERNIVPKRCKLQNMEFQGQKITDKKRKAKVSKEQLQKKIIAQKLLAKKSIKERKCAS